MWGLMTDASRCRMAREVLRCPGLASYWSCRRLNVGRKHLSSKAAEAVDAQADVEPVRADVHALDYQRQDVRLLCREQFVPQRIKLLKGRAGVGLLETALSPCPERLGQARRGLVHSC